MLFEVFLLPNTYLWLNSENDFECFRVSQTKSIVFAEFCNSPVSSRVYPRKQRHREEINQSLSYNVLEAGCKRRLKPDRRQGGQGFGFIPGNLLTIKITLEDAGCAPSD